MSTVTEAMTPATCEAPMQPHLPVHALCDPLAASDQMLAPEMTCNLRRANWTFSMTLAVPRITVQLSSGQSRPEHCKVATECDCGYVN